MDDRSSTDADNYDGHLALSLKKLASGDKDARAELIEIACARMGRIAHRMLQRFPTVRRWDQTDDIVQNASLRLYRALGDMVPESARHFTGLAAMQIRRELLDLARKYAGPESHAAHQETNYARGDGVARAKVDDAAAPAVPADGMEQWARLHEAAASLPEDEREQDVDHLNGIVAGRSGRADPAPAEPLANPRARAASIARKGSRPGSIAVVERFIILRRFLRAPQPRVADFNGRPCHGRFLPPACGTARGEP